jgi:argininosuccinate lyase
MANLWTGRFKKEMNALVQEFNASIGFDCQLYEYDIIGSIAHATMLAEQGIISNTEGEMIIKALKGIKERIRTGEIQFTSAQEDIHMAIESILIQELGDVGKKLHTARSRNDQVNVDVRMYLKDQMKTILEALIELENTLLTKAESNIDRMMPGFTHLQHAQPVTIGFHMMAYFQKFRRDIERLDSCYSRVDICPLGACALAGTTLPINRKRTAEILNFGGVSENSMDTVSDRDFITEFLSFSAICMTHLSRFSEEFILWNSQEFGYINIDDSFCTGSSIMPQKKNPDVAELIRGKSGRVYGNLIRLLTITKGQPLSFNKDFQEDKEALFDTVETLKSSILIFSKMLEQTEFNYETIESHLNKGFLNATDIAEHFVKLGIPFRKAHEMVGEMVKYCEEADITFEELSEEDLHKIDAGLTKESLPNMHYMEGINNRNSFGGTSPQDVKRQIKAGKEFIRKCDEMKMITSGQAYT